MAGAGFKDFAVGEVLTASDVDTYLMQQTVMRFADAAARGSALGTATGAGTALAEGMVSYLDDLNAVQVYDGSAWGQVGGLVAVKHALFTGTQTNSTAAGANFAVTDLSITHEVADAANKLIISVFIGALGTDDDLGNVGVGVYDGSSLLAVGDTDGNRTSVTAGGQMVGSGGDSGLIVNTLAATFVHTPGTGSKTYTVRAINIDNSTQTLYVNRGSTDPDEARATRSASGLVIQEVKA